MRLTPPRRISGVPVQPEPGPREGLDRGRLHRRDRDPVGFHKLVADHARVGPPGEHVTVRKILRQQATDLDPAIDGNVPPHGRAEPRQSRPVPEQEQRGANRPSRQHHHPGLEDLGATP